MTTPQIQNKHHLTSYYNELFSSPLPRISVILRTPGGGGDWRLHQKRLNGILKDLGKKEDFSEIYGDSGKQALQSSQAHCEDSSLWSGSYESICLHASPATVRLHKLDYPLDEYTHAGRDFLYKPLLRHFASRFKGWVLHLTLKSPDLFKVEGESITRISDSGLPESIYALSEAEIVDGGQRAHIRKSHSQGRPDIVSQGVDRSESPRELNEPAFIREVLQALEKQISKQPGPVLIIGDSKIVSTLDNAFTNADTDLITVTDAPEPLKESDILTLCREKAAALYVDRKTEIIATMKEADPTLEQFSDNLKEIYEAACQGRVEWGILAQNALVWAHYHPTTATLESADEHKRIENNAMEVLDNILLETVLKGGHCFTVSEEELTGKTPVVAKYRW